MAKKATGAKKMESATVPRKRTGIAVRLDLASKDHDRLERASQARGLTKASYARMAVLELLKRDEETTGGK